MIRVIIASDKRAEGSSTVANQIYFALKEKGFNAKIEAHTHMKANELMLNKYDVIPDSSKEIVIFDTINGKDFYDK